MQTQQNKHPANDPVFPAKLLLFGEHVLLCGAAALAVPAPIYGGRWVMAETAEGARIMQRNLREFAESELLSSIKTLDIQGFIQDVEQGLYFQSNIPGGYGLGSSGALCAAIYDRYCLEKTSDLRELKAVLAQMEGYFHGASSGIDPLTSYLNHPILIERKTEVRPVDMPDLSLLPTPFLLDSQLPRKTGPLVQWFLEQSESGPFADMLRTRYLPAHERMVESWLNADHSAFWAALRLVSELQREFFTSMVPRQLHAIWDVGLNSDAFLLKICGAGGGGFMLGFAKTDLALQECGKQFMLTLPFQIQSDPQP